MRDVFVCDAVRTPDRSLRRLACQGARRRSGGGPDQGVDGRHPELDWSAVDEVYFGCANQAGEDNRNVARMALLLAGLPESGSRRDAEPSLRLGPGCGRRGGAGDTRR